MPICSGRRPRVTSAAGSTSRASRNRRPACRNIRLCRGQRIVLDVENKRAWIAEPLREPGNGRPAAASRKRAGRSRPSVKICPSWIWPHTSTGFAERSSQDTIAWYRAGCPRRSKQAADAVLLAGDGRSPRQGAFRDPPDATGVDGRHGRQPAGRQAEGSGAAAQELTGGRGVPGDRLVHSLGKDGAGCSFD